MTIKYTDVAASVVTYDNSTSGLNATDAKAAIDELKVDIGTGAPSTTPVDGSLYVDDTTSSERLYVRVGGAWLSVALS